MLVKEKLHRLIDQIQDEKALEAYLNLIMKLNTHESGRLYSKLTREQKEELELSYQESFEEVNLISNEMMRDNYSKWL